MTEPSTIELPDGRTLSYAEYGDAEGRPVFAFHGVIGSRLMWSLCDEDAAERDVRLIAPDRPGFGASDFQRDRRLLDWPEDVCVLADELGIDRFGVTGFSGGGPHAMACAHTVPERVRGVSLVSTVTPPGTRHRADPFNEAVLSATRFVPGFSQTAFATSAWLADNAWPQFRTALKAGSPPEDRAVFDGPAGETLFADGAEAFRNGARGPAHDLPLVGDDWGFDVSECRHDVALWHGRADATVGPDLARAFGDLLPVADLYLGDGAHYSTYVDNRGAILDAAAG
ncbi:alpha/beta hydrolase fold protein [Halosimplex carlsbadense 2-9-1]|uniref:Alpha/beta hydrolase fold protein n=1 Tax=Halosimplex carlsbadense 2-9-1 TaxID=797114 RepID=M0D016_9EURY|nr:alpha/beta hydrolase [Halosimplex carlsbadense]ELZ27479.1 alpha/beta hydrolase fold protein [Halosimplex carlsbadense 2-9-1]